MSAPLILSFGNWPKELSFSRSFNASPTTKKIINNVKIDLDSILPITFAEFVLENNLIDLKKNESEELYGQEIKRREKKLEILQ